MRMEFAHFIIMMIQHRFIRCSWKVCSVVGNMTIVATIDSPIFNVLAILYEVDLYKTWVPRQGVSQILHSIAKFRFLCYYVFDMPWPVANRDCVCYGIGIDMLEQQKPCILVSVHSLPNAEYNNYGNVVPPEQSVPVRMDCQNAGYEIESCDI